MHRVKKKPLLVFMIFNSITKMLSSNSLDGELYDDSLEIKCETDLYVTNNNQTVFNLKDNIFSANFFEEKIFITDRDLVMPDKTIFNAEVEVKKEIVLEEKRQWILFKYDNFKTISENLKTRCGNYDVLGGYCVENRIDPLKPIYVNKQTSKGQNQNIKIHDFEEKAKDVQNNVFTDNNGFDKKKQNGFDLIYENLPSHSYIKIRGYLHFIDFWQGEYVFFKSLNSEDEEEVIFSQKADLKECVRGENICGGTFDDPSIGYFFDVIFSHESEFLKLRIDSALKEDPCLTSFGISDLNIYFL